MQYFRVENGITKLIEETVVYEAATKDFASLLATPRDNNIMHIPGQTRGVFANGEAGTVAFLIEQPPTVRTISWPTNRTKHKPYTLAIPWVYFVMVAQRENPEDVNSKLVMSSWAVYCTKKRFEGLEDEFWPLPINNVYQDGRICFGTAAADPGQNIGDHIDALIINFWNANFNYDVWPHLPGFADYREWQKATQDDPTCWLKWPWNDRAKWDTRTYKVAALLKIAEDRLSPAILPNAIPDLPMSPTFGRAAEWVSTLSEANKRLLLAALRNTTTPDDEDTDDEDIDDEEQEALDGMVETIVNNMAAINNIATEPAQ